LTAVFRAGIVGAASDGRRRRVRVIATVLASAGGMLVLAGSAGGFQTYPDTAGDAGAGPDIRRVGVSNDARGTITWRVTTALPLSDAFAVGVYIDIDKRASTGAEPGLEVVVFVSPARDFVGVLGWDGSRLVGALSRTLRVAARADVVELSIHRSELGNTRGFRFSVKTSDASGTTLFDSVPEKGMTTYDFWACSNGVDDDRDGRVDFPRDRGCSSAQDDVEAESVRRRGR
jgi:hypothetical protein